MAGEVRPVDAAKLSGYSLAHIYYLLRTGELAGRQVYGQWLIPVDALKSLPRFTRAEGL